MRLRTLYVPVAAVMAWFIVVAPESWQMADTAQKTVAGAMHAPFQYRILSALVYVALEHVAGGAALWLMWLVLLSVAAILMDAWLRAWMNEAETAAGVFLTQIVAYGLIVYMPTAALPSMFEMLFWAGALLLLVKDERRSWPFVALVFLASLNRETAIFLVALVFLATRQWRLTVAMGAMWVVTYGGLRLLYSDVEPAASLARIWTMNTQTFRLSEAVVAWTLFAWVPVLALASVRKAPDLIRRAAFVAAGYTALILVFGIWREIRLFLPLLPVAIPLVMGVQEEDM